MRTEELYANLLALLVITVAVLVVIVRPSLRRSAVMRGEWLDAAARALGGDVVKDAAFDEPVVRFSVGGMPSYFRYWMLFGGKSDVVTTFECRTGFGGFLEATSRRALRYPSRSPRFQVLPEQSGYQIVTTDPAWANDLLERGLSRILRETFGWWHRARITLAPDRFLVEFESRLTPDRAVEVARLIARVAALSRPSDQAVGVTFLDAVQVSRAGRCPVCGQELDRSGVHCAQCRVPHHADCWAYWGRCAIFGCRGRASATSASPG